MTDNVVNNEVKAWVSHAMYAEMASQAIDNMKNSVSRSQDTTDVVQYAAVLGSTIMKDDSIPARHNICDQLVGAIDTIRDNDIVVEQKAALLADLSQISAQYNRQITQTIGDLDVGAPATINSRNAPSI